VPSRFRRDLKHNFFMGEKAANKWREIVAARATQAGDQALMSADLPPVGGTKVIEAANIPVTTGSPDTAPVLFTDPKNLILGIRTGIRGGGAQGISMKVQDWPKGNRIEIIVRARAAFGVMHEAAAAKGTNFRATT
jgi:hypothetical protein